jgi:hypothetical protein
MTCTLPPVKEPVTKLGVSCTLVASWKLPPVIVAVGVQERQSFVCWTLAFHAPGNDPEAVPVNLPSVEVK